MSKKQYTTVEIVCNITKTEMGDVVAPEIAARGTLLATQRKQPRLIISTLAKNCLANEVPGLPEATTIVHIPDADMHRRKLDREQWTQAFWYACDTYGVPLWTQSSIKHLTFYFVTKEMFDQLAAKWDLANDGPRFAAYIGLLFSEMTDTIKRNGKTVKHTPMVELDIPEVAQCLDGEDGNCLWKFDTMQFRGMVQDADGLPISLAKGIGVSVKEAPSMMALNDSQVKHGQGGKFTIMRNAALSARPIKMWISAEPVVLLHDNSEVRNFIAGRVRNKVGEYLSLLCEEGRAELLKRLGGLRLVEGGELADSQRAVIEALRSNTPWCAEIEERVTRFAIREITEHIIPSGAIEGYASLMVISDTYGVAPCAWKDAKCFVVRIPVTGANAVIPMPKSPYGKGKGMVVTSDVAKLASGDADGDLLVCVNDPNVVDLFRKHLNHSIVSGMKPEKSKAKHALTPLFMEDAAIRQVGNAWMVGALTIAGWKMIQAGNVALASKMLELANIEPMTYKHHIVIEGQEFATYAMEKYGEVRDSLQDIALQWRDRAHEARGWASIRKLAGSNIENPASHLDWSWNAAVDAAVAWAAKNKPMPLSLSAVAHLAFGTRRIEPSAADQRSARGVIVEWGEYWGDVRRSNALQGDHSALYKRVCDWGKQASLGELAALMVWRPTNPESTGFSLKWHAVYAAGRASELLGLHQLVAEALKAMREELDDLRRQEALLSAVLEAIH